VSEWFDQPPEPGLRFECTMCGHCCTGPPGFVLVTESETDAIADAIGVPRDEFRERYTNTMRLGRSLNEHETEHGFDCVFLDRESVPGRAVCGIYEQRPMQCRTWPFWEENVSSARAWSRASKSCPGINKGPLHPPVQIRVARDRDHA
jgi:Fe-S-cluster containining protein